ncbi:MAG: DNA primase [Candidatus Levyibacteriota bacterium]
MDQVSQVREKIDIVSLISEYLPLARAGRNFKTNCPFHSEKTPSFVVSPERQIWHCFGCQKGGDCFTFLMEYENLEFPESLRILAKKAGVALAESSWQAGVSSKKEKIYKLNNLASEFYHYLLTKHNVGKNALDYLSQRQISKGLLKTFMLGFAPRINNALSNYLIHKKKYQKEDLIDAGLSSQRGKEIVDFFNNRIIFPIIDHRGNIIGFSGRTMNDSLQISKYVNTRETLVYHKGESFYNLNNAKEEIKKENRAIVVEGEFDVVSSFSCGIKNVVAVKGTALTENQAGLLSRFCQKVSLCFDMDSAGQEAIKRSLPFLEKKGLTATVIILPNGKDPDELIKKNSASFQKAIKNDLGVYDFLLQKAVSDFDKKTAFGKKKIGDEVFPYISEIENEIVKEHYLKKLAEELDTTFESILKQEERIKKKEKDNSQSFAIKDKRTRIEVLEEYLLALIFQSQEKNSIIEKTQDLISDFLEKQSACQKILDLVFDFKKLSAGKEFDEKKFFTSLPSELQSVYNTSFLFPLPKFESKTQYLEEAQRKAEELRVLYLKEKINAISNKLREQELEKEDEEKIEKLKKEHSRLVRFLEESQKSLD